MQHQRQLRRACRTWCLIDHTQPNLVADGDSITAGTGATPWTYFIRSWLIHNVALPGETLATMLANAPTAVDPLLKSPYVLNVVTVWGGTNDISLGATPATTYANLKSYCDARHAAGWKCIVATMLSRVGLDASKNTYNNLILADHSFADGLVDFTGTVLGCDGCYSNLSNFSPDGTHPLQSAINAIEVPAFNTAINAIPNPY